RKRSIVQPYRERIRGRTTYAGKRVPCYRVRRGLRKRLRKVWRVPCGLAHGRVAATARAALQEIAAIRPGSPKGPPPEAAADRRRLHRALATRISAAPVRRADRPACRRAGS